MRTKKELLLDFVKQNKYFLLSAFIFGFLSIVSSLLIPLLLGKFYQLVLHTHSEHGKIFDKVFWRIKDMNTYFILFGAIILLKFVFNFFELYFLGVSGEKLSKYIRETLFQTQLVTSISDHNKKDTGKYLLRYSGDLSATQNYITKGIITFINDSLFILLTIVLFFLMEFYLTLIILISFLIIFVIIFYLNKKLKKLISKRRNVRSDILSFVSSRLYSILTIKIFNRESIESEKFNKKADELYRLGVKYFKLYAFIGGLLPFLIYTMLGVVLFASYFLKHKYGKEIHGSEILVFIMLVVNTFPFFRRILKVNTVWQAGDVSIRKLLKIYNVSVERRIENESAPLSKYNIEFQNVSFSFDKQQKIIDNLSFTIKENGITLIRGYQGSGKTIIFKLILGLYEVDSGKILIGDTDIAEISRFALRKNITMVSNELPLLGKTVFEAISYSRKDEKRERALTMLENLNFSIPNVESILDYPVVDGGKNLSAGQKKLLLIARAFLTSKKIILLDEPFTDIDESTKAKIIEELNKLGKKRTILIIDREKSDTLALSDEIKLAVQKIKFN